MGGANGVGGANNFNNQIGQANNQTDALFRNRTDAQPTTDSPGDSQSNGILQNFYERQGITYTRQQFLLQRQQNNLVQSPPSDDGNINGITEKSEFPTTIAADESEASVLRRAYTDIARAAGLSDEKKTFIRDSEEVSMSNVDSFVEERMSENRAANNNQETIYHSETGKPFTPDEWKQKQQTGSITMSPTTDDIEALKNFKAGEDYEGGSRAANQVLRAMQLGDRSALEKLFSDVDASTELGKALDSVRAQNDNPNFQRGFIDALGADKFLKLEGMLSNNRTGYDHVMQKSLSAASRSELFPADIQQQIAQKSDLKTLVRLTGNPSAPMGRDFLVETGKRIMTQDFGWTTRAGGEMGVAVKYNIYNPGTKEILQAIAKNPDASLELLQNADFVKNALKLENSGENEDTISQIIRSGMSKDMQANNGEKLDNALRIIIEAAKDPNAIRGTSKSGLHESSETISERTAITLAEVYQNNIDSFSLGTGRSGNRTNSFSTDDARTFLSVIQPYSAVKDANGVTLGDKIAAATAVKYMDLLGKAESSGDISYAEKAANLAATYIDAKNQSNLSDAKEAEARREQLGKMLGIVSEITVFYGGKAVINEVLIDALGKAAAAATEGSVKSNDVDDAVKLNRATLENQQAANKISLVQIYEQAASERLGGARAATTDEKARAQQFLSDLREYNESLPANAKILDANGRLISPSKMSDRQKDSMEDIFQGSENQARRRLSDRMNAIYDKLTLRTEVQIKN